MRYISFLTFRTFFSNISNLFRNSMKDVFCTPREEKKEWTWLMRVVTCKRVTRTITILQQSPWKTIVLPQNKVALGPIRRVLWSPSFGSCCHPQKAFDRTWVKMWVQKLLTYVKSQQYKEKCRSSWNEYWWSYSLMAAQNITAVTPSKRWIHFRLSFLWPPTSKSLYTSPLFLFSPTGLPNHTHQLIRPLSTKHSRARRIDIAQSNMGI